MQQLKIAAVMRANAYSPNHIGNDAAILSAVAENLSGYGHKVEIFTEDAFNTEGSDAPVIVNMCREQRSVALLKDLEKQGRLVINSGYGIENCTRERMTRLLVANGIPYPESLIVDTGDDVGALMEQAGFTDCWIKRGDYHSMHKEDVSYARHIREAQDVLREYKMRGIGRAVINRHLTGDLVKFYGIAGSDFFYWFYPYDRGHSKYGHEAINGKSHGFAFDPEQLRLTAQKAGEALDVKIYGGDCIVDEQGRFSIIDFNDWPSFAPCRDEAAPHIAQMIQQNILQYNTINV